MVSSLPWVADGVVVESFDAPLSPDIAATHANAIWTPTDDEQIACANAEFIARACNSHEMLVEACKKALTCASLNSDVATLIRAALAATQKGE